MAELYDWNNSADDNNDSPPNGWPEEMAPGLINNTGREMMAVLARYRQSVDGCNRTGGVPNGYTLTVPQTITALTAGMRFSFCPHASSVAAAGTLQVNTNSAVTLRGAHSTTLLASELRSDTLYVAVYNGTDFIVLNPSITGTDGFIPLSRLPDTLTGKDADMVDGFHVSTDATGDDASTIYFRT